MVLLDDGRGVDAHDAAVGEVQSAADALAVAAAVAPRIPPSASFWVIVLPVMVRELTPKAVLPSL